MTGVTVLPEAEAPVEPVNPTVVEVTPTIGGVIFPGKFPGSEACEAAQVIDEVGASPCEGFP